MELANPIRSITSIITGAVEKLPNTNKNRIGPANPKTAAYQAHLGMLPIIWS